MTLPSSINRFIDRHPIFVCFGVPSIVVIEVKKEQNKRAAKEMCDEMRNSIKIKKDLFKEKK